MKKLIVVILIAVILALSLMGLKSRGRVGDAPARVTAPVAEQSSPAPAPEQPETTNSAAQAYPAPVEDYPYPAPVDTSGGPDVPPPCVGSMCW